MKLSTLKVLLRSDFIKKDGTNSIYLLLTINREKRYYSLKVSCHKDKWDYEKLRLKAAAINSFKNNTIINEAVLRADTIIYNYRKNNKQLTFDDFESEFFNQAINRECFYTFIENDIKLSSSKLAPDYIRTLNTQISKLKKFCDPLNLNDIDINFIKEYENYMYSELKNCHNTVNKSLSFIKLVLNKAIQQDKIKETPFRNFHLTKAVTNRAFLSMSELEVLQQIYDNNEITGNQKEVLKYFLFSCYTGLRYQDIKSIKYKNIQDNIISIPMHKTKYIVRIPLIDKAINLIGINGIAEQTIFNVFTNQATNRHLKDIMTLAEIKKQICFHCARHTFATIAIGLTIPIDVISKILGHTDIKTTLIYAKYTDAFKIKEMQKWNNVKMIVKN